MREAALGGIFFAFVGTRTWFEKKVKRRKRNFKGRVDEDQMSCLWELNCEGLD